MINYLKIINDSLNEYLCEEKIGNSTTANAMRYAVLNGGKRVRSQLFLCMLNDLDLDYSKYLNVACAIECLHTYSLIHDDLPAMDNDDYRRNLLTVHKKYGEDIGILAGDALLTYSFELLSLTNNIKLSNILAVSSGVKGMILGQELDLKAENQIIDLDNLKLIDYHKTGQLLTAPLLMALIIANKEEYADKIKNIGFNLGLAFQIQDDILDVTLNLKKSGCKSSDIKNNKSTYVSLLGIEESQNIFKKLYFEIIDDLKTIINKPDSDTIKLIKSLINRTK